LDVVPADDRREAVEHSFAAKRTGRNAYHFYANADFACELGLGLSLRREGVLDGLTAIVRGHDIQVGDAAFDKRFLLRADPASAERVAPLFDPPACEALLAIDARAGALTLGDRSIHIDSILLSFPPEDLGWLVDTLADVAGRISKNFLRGRADTGPYR
jgi:hypothetical protein